MSTPNPVPGNEPTPAVAPPPAAAVTGAVTPPPSTTTGNVVWPDLWRQTIAGTDEQELKLLERYATPADVWKKARSFEQRMSSGELRAVTAFPEKGTPEQQAAWRVENGIPEAPEKYDLKLNDGLVIGEDDKPIIDSFLKSVHGKHVPPAAASAAVQWYFDFKEQEAEQRSLRDAEAVQTNNDTLRNVWGPDYRPNLNAVHSLLDTAPAGIKDMFLGGRLADGTPIGSSSDMLQFIASLSRQLNPQAALMGSNSNPIAITDEIAAIEKRMREDRAGYNVDEKQQARYRDLITARDKNKA
jgi:hypothetical protein